jgi:acyl-CoA thioester hydrolase
VRESMIHFGYELLRADNNELLAEGDTMHMILDAKLKPAALPENYLRAFRSAIGK